MKRYITRDKSAEDTLFTVFSELGEELYSVRRSKKCVIMTDKTGERLLKIKKLPFPNICAYSITAGNNNIKFFLNPRKQSSYFYGTPWQIRGDAFKKSFDIIDADNSLVCSHESSFKDGRSCYLLEIAEDRQELLCIGTAICANIHETARNLCVQTV